jgi:hypothetical protein
LSDAGAESPANPAGQRRLLKIGLMVALVVAVAGGAFAVGRMSIDQDEIRKEGFTVGFDTGREEGYDAGYGVGAIDGRKQGCEDVFEFTDGRYQYVTPYAPFDFADRYPGQYYASRDQC